jgi:hypothetical protein
MKQIFLMLLLAAGFAATAQTDTTGNKPQKDSTRKGPQFKLSLNYNSNLHYYGRTDSFRSSGFFPLAEFYITPKFYVNAAPIFVSNKFQSFDYAGTVATVGYLNVTDKWITTAYALKPFYTASAQLVQSALQAQTGVSATRLRKGINVTLGADAKFSDAVDFGASAGLDHIIRKILPKRRGVIVVDPAIDRECRHAALQHDLREKTERRQRPPGPAHWKRQWQRRHQHRNGAAEPLQRPELRSFRAHRIRARQMDAAGHPGLRAAAKPAPGRDRERPVLCDGGGEVQLLGEEEKNK